MYRNRIILLCFTLLLIVGATYYIYQNISINTEISETESARTKKMNAPNDHFFTQRTYPDLIFDHKAYVDGLNQATADHNQAAFLKSSNTYPASWTTQGPGNIGGRINCIAVHPADTNIMFAGNAAGGIFRTTDSGVNWLPVFDDHSYLAIGTIVFEPGNPNTIYVGTGDPNIGGYMFVGDGVYKSTDGGDTWINIGLNDQGIVSKIIIHPANPNIIYVGTMGLPFLRNNDRGLYKTIDGGQTWNHILFISDDAGIIDMVMDHSNPQIIYAAGWNRIRNNQESLVSGPAAKIYKTTDGGATWNILTSILPQADMSRIGLAMSATNSNILYAQYVDTNYDLEGIYKTTDGGNTWTSVPISTLHPNAMGGFGWYFGKIRVSPYNDNELHVLGVDLHKTTDGGNNWYEATPPWWQYDVHADKHDLVYTGPGTYILTTDGGIYKTNDGGNTWTDIENIANTQFYRVAMNPHQPGVYWGGTQDNGTTSGNVSGINNWERIFGGDGFQPVFHPTNPNLYYVETQNGNLWYTDDGGGTYYHGNDGIDPIDRRNWDMPVIMSATDPDIMYTGTYRIYQNISSSFPFWIDISPDLTDGIVFAPRFHNITTIAESPVNSNYLYAGTSDGNVWRSLNGGGTWVDITSTLPDRYVTSIKTSPSNPATVYVSHSGYKSFENIPHIHKSMDNGSTWIDISGNLPQLAINSIMIYPANENFIFVATDGGVYGTIDGGTNWSRVGLNMPVIPVYDLTYDQPNNRLVAGTFARSIMTYPVDSIVTSVNNISSAIHVGVYPNPTTKILNINSNENHENVFIFNSVGGIVKELKLKKGINPVAVQNLKTGVYFVSGTGDEGRFKVKFVKK